MLIVLFTSTIEISHVHLLFILLPKPYLTCSLLCVFHESWEEKLGQEGVMVPLEWVGLEAAVVPGRRSSRLLWAASTTTNLRCSAPFEPALRGEGSVWAPS